MASAKLLLRLLALVALGLAFRQWTNRPAPAPAAPPVSPTMQVVQQALKGNRVMVRRGRGISKVHMHTCHKPIPPTKPTPGVLQVVLRLQREGEDHPRHTAPEVWVDGGR